ncbi:MAG: NUDIX domain-containing protein [Agathobacter sp.]|nr:NUDIX domain-containing protein [Agathobacter sp.]
MRILLSLDEKNYTDEMTVFEKYAVRGVIIRDGKIAMQKATRGYYKILGGGIDEGETYADALSRELQEESGLIVDRDSIKEIGEIYEARQDLYDKDKKFVCHTCFFFCDVLDERAETSLTASEIREGFELTWVSPEEIIKANDKVTDMPWVTRDTAFIKMLVDGTIEK